MKNKNPIQLLLACLLGLTICLPATAALVTVNSTEIWNGVTNPHASDGVTVSGSGTLIDPYLYIIPDGMTITTNGYIQLSSSADRDNPFDDFSITFQFSSGNLQMDAGATIDTQRPSRSGRRDFFVDMGGGSITGSGKIIGLRPTGDKAYLPRGLNIFSAQNISLATIDLHVENVNGNVPTLDLSVAGNITISGTVNMSDLDLGGNNVNNVLIQAETLNLNGVDTHASRSGGGARNGNITLRALASASNYDPAAANVFANRMVLNGPINTHGAGTTGGNITLEAVVLQLSGGFTLDKSVDGVLSARAGNDTLGSPQSDLFINVPGASITPTFDVNWNGVVTVGNAPVFTSHPINGTLGAPDVPYSFTLTATDPDGGTLTYSKGSGPAWMSVAANGAVTGTPLAADSGTNTFRVAVSDGVRFDITTLIIRVGGPPKFSTNLVVKPKAFQDTAYTGQTLADVASDLDGDPITFAKVSGPAWLNVAANGALSGTPSATDTFTNTWVVSVSDGTGTNTATLQILVGGGPRFFASPIVKPDGGANVDYAIGLQTLAVNAADPDDDTLTFSKLSGSAWLVVAANGGLSGTPGVGDVGTNTWTVQVADATRTATATLQIKVAAAGNITVSTVEVWDGVANPHAGQGVTLAGLGTEADPAVYIVPTALRITPTGQIVMTPPGNTNLNAIKFLIAGDLQMDSGAIINTEFYNNRDPFRHFILDMNGTNSITGSGKIVGITAQNSVSRVLTIQNVVNVSLASIDTHVNNANTQFRHAAIIASGAVVIPGKIDNSDQDAGGNNGSDVTIRASTIQVGSIDTSANRTSSDAVSNGRIFLYALSPEGNYDLNAGANNTISNRVHINGSLHTKGLITTGGGHITVQGTVVLIGPNTTITVPTAATITLDAGVVPQNGANTNDVFKDYADTGLLPVFDVQWSGPFTPSSLPAFTTRPMTRPDATEAVSYSGTLAGSATGGVALLTYGRTAFGPAWLQVASSGVLSGTPGFLDIGSNVFRIYVTDGNAYDTNVLTIVVKSNTVPGAITVTGVEVWDGVANPHGDQGVILTGTGTTNDPAVYTIPTGLHLTDTGEIQLDPPLAVSGAHSNSIVFNFTGGHLTMDAGSRINTAYHSRNAPIGTFTVRGAGTNNIEGAGSIIGLLTSTDTPRIFTISNMNNVAFSNIDLHVENVNNGGRTINIRANGAVNILNVDGSDRDTGGGSTAAINIFGNSVTVSNIVNESYRTSGGSGGTVTLRALSPKGPYLISDGADNNYPTNKLTVNGLISTWRMNTVKGGGALVFQGVIVELGPNFVNQQPPTNSTGVVQGTLTVDAGRPGGGLTETNFLINNSTVTSSARNFFLFDTLWSNSDIKIVLTGDTSVTISWSNVGATLQQNTDLGNTNGWINVPGGTSSPVTIPKNNATAFFRLKL